MIFKHLVFIKGGWAGKPAAGGGDAGEPGPGRAGLRRPAPPPRGEQRHPLVDTAGTLPPAPNSYMWLKHLKGLRQSKMTYAFLLPWILTIRAIYETLLILLNADPFNECAIFKKRCIFMAPWLFSVDWMNGSIIYLLIIQRWLKWLDVRFFIDKQVLR